MPDLLDPAIDPFERFAHWLEEATQTEPNDPNAMVLATATPGALPSARAVQLKGFDPAGFVFYGNQESRKGGELAANPHAALLFHWKTLRRQVRVEGSVEVVSDAEADAYFATRARQSQLGAHASDQSRPMAERALFELRLDALEQRYPGPVPRPAHWSGWRVVPRVIEFWQDMPFRLHDRLVYRREGTGWATTKLYP